MADSDFTEGMMTNDDPRREQSDAAGAGGMQGGGYGGVQGRGGEGRAEDATGAELQGGSFGRAWNDTPADIAGGGRLPADAAGHVPSGEGYAREDVHVALAVTDALAELRGTDTDHVRVRVERGVVTLTGHVPSEEALRAVQQAAGGVRGVREVRTQLDVGAATSAANVVADARTPESELRVNAVDTGEDELGRSADRRSTESPNLQTGDILGDLPSQP